MVPEKGGPCREGLVVVGRQAPWGTGLRACHQIISSVILEEDSIP